MLALLVMLAIGCLRYVLPRTVVLSIASVTAGIGLALVAHWTEGPPTAEEVMRGYQRACTDELEQADRTWEADASREAVAEHLHRAEDNCQRLNPQASPAVSARLETIRERVTSGPRAEAARAAALAERNDAAVHEFEGAVKEIDELLAQASAALARGAIDEADIALTNATTKVEWFRTTEVAKTSQWYSLLERYNAANDRLRPAINADRARHSPSPEALARGVKRSRLSENGCREYTHSDSPLYKCAGRLYSCSSAERAQAAARDASCSLITGPTGWGDTICCN